LADVGERYARKEKAARAGYVPDDEVFYSLAVIRELLPYVTGDELPTLPGVYDAKTSVARRSAAGPGMELETAVMDLRRAYSGLDEWDQAVLAAEAEFGMAEESDVIAAMKRMQRLLGGSKPRMEEAA
jgi:hypothetical protein